MGMKPVHFLVSQIANRTEVKIIYGIFKIVQYWISLLSLNKATPISSTSENNLIFFLIFSPSSLKSTFWINSNLN